MEPRISIVTLGVKEMQRSCDFYEKGLGFPTSGKADDPIVFFKLTGLVFAIYPRDKLAEDINPKLPPTGKGFSGFTLAHNARDKEHVDTILKQAEAAGGKIVKPAQTVFWGGYSGYFSDPDGYFWEVAWSKDFKFNEDGSLIIE